MNSNKDIRWKQRFQNFEKAYLLLKRTLEIENPSEAEQGGLIQFFETTFELSWKMLKDYLENEGFMVKSPRETIKQAYQIEVIDKGEEWLKALEDRNLSSHIYDEHSVNKVISHIRTTYMINFTQLYHLFLEKYNY